MTFFYFKIFQVFAKLMAILNFLVPILSWIFILTDNSMALNECLGKGYLNFLPTKNHYCTNDDILCWVWFGLVSIMMSDIIDFYCLYQCIKNIKKSTIESRYMLSKKAYTNRKRYGVLITICSVYTLLDKNPLFNYNILVTYF